MTKKVYLCSIMLIVSIILIGCVNANVSGLDGTEFYYTVDATKPETGNVFIDLKITNLPKGKWIMYQVAKNSVVKISNFKAKSTKGKELEVEVDEGEKPVRKIMNNKNQDVIFSYTATPGGKVKHGSQGHINSEFGLMTGQVFLHFYAEIRKERKNYSGESYCKKVRVKINTKDDWGVYSTMNETNEGYDPATNGKWAFHGLKYSNTAIGKFDTYEKKFGDVLHKVHLYSEWDKEEREAMADYSFRIYDEFHQQAPFEGLPMYTTIFVPKVPKGIKAPSRTIMGQIWSTGQAFSYDSYAVKEHGLRRRVWELYAHRISHAVNRYSICGTHTPNKFERWLDEAWASWVEITHTINPGVVKDQYRFDTLWRWYSRVFHGLDKRNEDMPIYKEKGANDHNIIRFLHYFKGPMLAQFLDYELRRLSDNKKSLNGFIKYYYPKYKNHKEAVPQRKELNKYMEDVGVNMDYFYDDYVKKTGYLYPIYDKFIEQYRNLEFMSTPTIHKKIGNYELNDFQHTQLVKFLKRLGIKENEEIENKIDEVVILMEEYKTRKLDVIPKEMIELHWKLPGDVQLIMFEHQKDILFHTNADYRKWMEKRKEELLSVN